MTTIFEQRKHQEQPEWINESSYVYTNEFGEKWVGIVKEDKLFFAGEEIGWQSIELTLKEVKFELDRLLLRIHRANFNYPLMGWVLNEGELYWMISVMKSAIVPLEVQQARKPLV